MSHNLLPQAFSFEGEPIRILQDAHGEPWFVLADLCRVLGIANPSAVKARLATDDVNTLSLAEGNRGNPNVTTVNESGMYEVVIRSDSPLAQPFRRWLTHEVLPAIRRHGAYATPATTEDWLSDPDKMIAALEALKAEREQRQALEAQAAITAPKAEAWDDFLGIQDDMAVDDAAKALARTGLEVGRTRLFRWLREHNWTYSGSDGSPRAVQTRIDQKLLSHKAQWHYHPRTGEKVLDAPQVRVTPKGLERIAKAMREDVR